MSARVVLATAFGGPEVLELVDREVAPPGPGEVSVDVRAIGVNPVDWKVVAGNFGRDGSRLPLPVGSELSGVVSAVGQGAGFAVGDEVVAYPVRGAYASAVTVPAEAVLPKPAGASFEQSAGLLLVGATAAHLVHLADVHEGQTVLVHGVAGSVGLVAAQLALRTGAIVVGTAAEHRHDALRRLGIVPVAYGEGLLERVRAAAPQGVDVALDTVGTDEAVDVSLALLPAPADLVSAAAFARGGDGIRLVGSGPGADPGTEYRARARSGLLDLLGRGELTLPVARTYPLAQVREALEFVRDGHAGGKVVLVP
ncbi:quinone oxidoreductase family protein [Kineococcus rhizosphaerae]|uniref:NADPH:quinone reductase-like Zn-dependent oxidoreductase n=1 Tax=Kineococcus rhizosphaerae TaxID=559628 RepID=A0A2T0R4Z8_9ACTN|nr:NADP-dependent oxidoreductase [Kineococcus rhizosphaerae]PRY15814.1 NADPH:quinone reductase-like Zn-dependent oxidoreductase [Kineococcus rhizosphaerae]